MITDAVSDFIVATDASTLPSAATAVAQRLLLDNIAVTLAGSREAGARAVAEYVAEQGERGDCTIIGTRCRTSAPLAALANGVSAHALDYDDISITWLGHPSCVLFPAVLAYGRTCHASGPDVLTAYVVGWEVGAAIGRTIRHRVHEAGWHSTGVTGTIAAAAACARVAGLDRARTRTALGIAASLASGMYINRGTATKPLHAGNAARNGLTAVELAQRGVGASDEIFDGPGDFCSTLVGEACDPAKMLDGLGTKWDILEPGATMKLHACCGASHYCIDALLDLVEKHHFRWGDVESIECQVPTMVPTILKYDLPSTGLEAKFSIAYPLAAALLDGTVGIEQFSDAAVQRLEARQLMQRIHYVLPEAGAGTTAEIVETPHEVAVRLVDGSCVRQACRYFRGRAERPLADDELIAKFESCVAGVLTPSASAEILDSVLDFEGLDDVSVLNRALASDES